MEHCRSGSMISAQCCREAQRCSRSVGKRLLLSRVVFQREWMNASKFWRSRSGWSAEAAVMMVLSYEAGKFISTSLIQVNILIELREIEKNTPRVCKWRYSGPCRDRSCARGSCSMEPSHCSELSCKSCSMISCINKILDVNFFQSKKREGNKQRKRNIYQGPLSMRMLSTCIEGTSGLFSLVSMFREGERRGPV